MKISPKLSLILLAVFCSTGLFSQSRSWTHFRGNQLDAVADQSRYPSKWSDSLNILWKAEIPGKGWSSPVVYGDQVWCTSASNDGKEMFAVCTDFNTGKEIFHIDLFRPDSVFRIHAVNSYATPTPCIEEGFIYAHFGRYGTACIDTKNGNIIWSRSDLQCEHIQGPGSSPVLYKNMLILHLEGTDVQNIYALDKKTGEIIWKIARPTECYKELLDIGKKAYITPLIVNVNGRDLLISNGSPVCIAYDVETGKEVWRIPQGEDSTIAMPVTWNGIVYYYTGFISPDEGEKYCELLAVNPDGEGDISASNILWREKSPILQLSTPVIFEGLLYTVDTRSILKCLDAIDGKEIWSDRLRGKFNSSPVVADGKVYFSSTNGNTFVYKTGHQLELLSENKLEGDIWTSPVFLEGNILLRTSKYLFKIGQE